MPADFTVIFSVRQHFGNNVTDTTTGFQEILGEIGAPFVGREKYYDFRCPNVNSDELGIIVFQSIGVTWRHELTINDQVVYGGIAPGASSIFASAISHTYSGTTILDMSAYPRLTWNTNSLIISKNVLRTNNILRITSLPDSEGRVDDFIIDNCLVHYKTN